MGEIGAGLVRKSKDGLRVSVCCRLSLPIHPTLLIPSGHEVGHQVAQFFWIEPVDQAGGHLGNGQLLGFDYIVSIDDSGFCSVIGRVNGDFVPAFDNPNRFWSFRLSVSLQTFRIDRKYHG